MRWRVLAGFASPQECAALVARARAQARGGWEAGRQGTGYQKLRLEGALGGVLDALTRRSLDALGDPAAWDRYLLRYLAGTFIPPHVDPPLSDGLLHVRLNLLVAQSGGGGVLRLDGCEAPLAVGDAIVFRPDLSEHEVSPVGGLRLVWSVGANLAPEREPPG